MIRVPGLIAELRKLIAAPEPAAKAFDDLHQAVAVLLVEAARMDDTFDADERATIERLLSEWFSLSADATRELLVQAEATAKNATQLYPFTRTAVTRMEPEQRVRLIEMLWEVAYADGVLDADEDMLIRRVAGLIYVSDADRMEARRRVLARLGKN